MNNLRTSPGMRYIGIVLGNMCIHCCNNSYVVVCFDVLWVGGSEAERARWTGRDEHSFRPQRSGSLRPVRSDNFYSPFYVFLNTSSHITFVSLSLSLSLTHSLSRYFTWSQENNVSHVLSSARHVCWWCVFT